MEITQRLDEATKQNIDGALALLNDLVNAESPRSAVREHAGELDDVFMSILTTNMARAEKEKREDLLERLSMIYDEIMAMMDESMPPEVQFINDLMRAPYPDGTREMLQAHKADLTPELLEVMDQLAVDLASREGPESAEMGKRLSDIRAQAMLLV